MAELTISKIIKILIAVFVVVVVVAGIYLAFKEYVIPYFENIFPSTKLFLSLKC